MTNKEIYKVWAPEGAEWTEWVRPVPFVFMNNYNDKDEIHDFKVENIYCSIEDMNNAAIIIDMPEYESIEVGISLIKYGYRPIPVFNGVIEQDNSITTTNNHAFVSALTWGALELQRNNIKNDALPAFLLDRNRKMRYKMNPSVFDNSWDIYGQDLPSADYLKNHNIKNILIIGDFIQVDLKRILCKYQKEGLHIYYTDGYSDVKPIRLKMKLKEKKIRDD
jgi:hypothetical protein